MASFSASANPVASCSGDGVFSRSSNSRSFPEMPAVGTKIARLPDGDTNRRQVSHTSLDLDYHHQLAKRIKEICLEVCPSMTTVAATSPRTQLETLRLCLIHHAAAAPETKPVHQLIAGSSASHGDALGQPNVVEPDAPREEGYSDAGVRKSSSSVSTTTRGVFESGSSLASQQSGTLSIDAPRATKTMSPTNRRMQERYTRVRGRAALILATVPFYYCYGYRHNYIDENFAITRNQDVMQTRWADIWVHDFWGWTLTPDDDHWTSKSYRPLVTLSYALQVSLGHDVGLMRVGNCMVHTINSLLIYSLLDYHFLAALTFAWHPIHVENIVYLVGRADSLATTFCLLAFTCSARRSPMHILLPQRTLHISLWHRGFSFTWVAVCTILAGLSKEIGFTLPVIFAFRYLWTDSYRRATCYLLYFALVAMIRSWFVGGADVGFSYIDTPIRYQDSIVDRTLSYLMLHSTYAQLLVTPFHQSWDYSFDSLPIVRTFIDLRLLGVVTAYLSIIMLFSLGSGTARRGRNLPVLLWAGSWVAIPFLPMSNLFFLVGTTVGERLLYPSSVGWALLVTRVPRKIIAALVLWYAYRSVVRVHDWRSPADLFVADSMHWDRSAKILHQRGVVDRGQGNYLEALQMFNRSLEVFDDNALTDFMIAQIQMDLGRCDLALERFHKINNGHGIGFGDHNHALFVAEFAFANVCTKNFAQAIALFETELPFTRALPHLINAYVLALDAGGHKQKALDVMQDAIEIFPTHALLWTNLGTLCSLDDLPDCFEKCYQKAAELSVNGELKEALLESVKKKTPQEWSFFRD